MFINGALHVVEFVVLFLFPSTVTAAGCGSWKYHPCCTLTLGCSTLSLVNFKLSNSKFVLVFVSREHYFTAV